MCLKMICTIGMLIGFDLTLRQRMCMFKLGFGLGLGFIGFVGLWSRIVLGG